MLITYEKIDVSKVRDAVVHDSAGAVLILKEQREITLKGNKC